MAKKIAFYTMGCKVNLYDSQASQGRFAACGYEIVNFDEAADVYVVNTCSVTHMADKKSRQAVRRALSQNPGALVCAMGCASELDPAAYKAAGAGVVVGTKRDELLDYVESYFVDRQGDDMPAVYANIKTKTRAFLKAQDGCNNFCTFCVIPYARGRSVSRPFDDVIKEAKALIENGYREIVLCGIHIASYGKDLDSGHNLLSLLEALCKLDGLWRLRLSSVEPTCITDEFIGFMREHPLFCRHLHLSLQSGSQGVLRRMARRYTADEYRMAVNLLNACFPNISITTDVIAGFPDETEAEHEESMAFIERVKLSRLHVFNYSKREGTAAAYMGGHIPTEIKKRRVKELTELNEQLMADYHGLFIGQVMPILVEKAVNGMIEGKTDNYITVKALGDNIATNTMVNVRLLSLSVDGLYGEVVE